ncbi:MAG: beta-N-acetylhexosaminidase [Capsulimonadaceae bacterium]|nr:beta-N-acetylhexosaminidase [Capsulimonadaceae bacterium]
MSNTPALIPRPRKVTYGGGFFLLSNDIAINAAGRALAEAEYLAGGLASALGQRPQISVSAARPSISLTIDESEDGIGREGYRLAVSQDGIRIVSTATAGLFYGIQTLLQLVPGDAANGSRAIPFCEIDDAPQFPWRGLMLDVSRYYMPVPFLIKLIDVMAMHKFNTLHLHLTDDQGWRLEIAALPELARTGASRRETLIGHGNQDAATRRFDGKPDSGYYSKHDVRAMVAHAARRHVTLLPEIEMPGHAQAALACYPNLSCTGEPCEVSRLWGVHKEVYCAGNDEVFTFLETVLDETLALFPSAIIHIGGDECPKDRWKACPKCQQRIRDEKLADEHELQSWFIRRIQRFLSERGRSLIGWDEILEGGLAPGATVMSWRGEEGGIAAARSGHDVVMAPNKSTYLDYYQADPASEPLAIGGLLPLRNVYEYHPIPAELTPAESKHILGTQGQLWTEYMPTPEHVEYMAFPRACALAEVAWGTSDAGDYDGFLARLKMHLSRLSALGVNYRRLDG